MASKDQVVKTRVGIFVFISLIMLGIMVIYFGRLGDGFRRYYRINATFPTAAGLLKGADVQMAGSKIGIVETTPKIIQLGAGVGVEVPLQIYDNIQIPSDATLMIRRTGLLGDRFVEVMIMKPADWNSPPLAPGSMKAGEREMGLDDITLEAGKLMQKAQSIVDEAKAKMDTVSNVVDRLDGTVFSKQTLDQAAGTIANLNTTSQKFAEASGKFEGIIDEAQKTTKSLQSTIADVNVIVRDTKNGRGTIGALLTDRTIAENLRAFVLNLKEHGVIWYKDTTGRGR